MGPDSLTARLFQDATGTDDWRVVAVGADAWFDAPSHLAGAALVRRIAELTDDVGGEIDIDLRRRGGPRPGAQPGRIHRS